jgi:pimeloyl-ACP methyl ester carboxylesterase
VLIHGLGGNKTSFFETVSALAPQLTVHAIDLPGFGSSPGPFRAPCDAPWFSHVTLDLLDALGIERAHLVGNSMGARVAIEVGLAAPDRVASLSLLSSSLAWRRRRALVPLVRLLRPELAAVPHKMRTAIVRRHYWRLFARPERLHPSSADLASEEFLRAYGTLASRVAFYAAARNIYLEEPFGEQGFWTRLERLEPAAMFVWGDQDPLVPVAFMRHVRQALPAARQVVLEECGHVPQVELPERTNALIRGFIAEASASAATRAAARLGRAARRLARTA